MIHLCSKFTCHYMSILNTRRDQIAKLDQHLVPTLSSSKPKLLKPLEVPPARSVAQNKKAQHSGTAFRRQHQTQVVPAPKGFGFRVLGAGFRFSGFGFWGLRVFRVNSIFGHLERFYVPRAKHLPRLSTPLKPS